MNINVPPQPMYTVNLHPWTTGLCDCFDDPSNCFVTYCFPCITFGRNAEIIDRGSTSCATNALIYCLLASMGCGCCYSYPYRTKLRDQFQLEEAPMGDCLLHYCCAACALCQEHRELKSRGYDPTIGWQANQARISNAANVPPPVQPDMRR